MITKNKVKELRNKLDILLKEFNETSDIKMYLGNGSFNEDTLSFKLLGGLVKKGIHGSNLITKEAIAFKRLTYSHKISEKALFYKFNHLGLEYEITGYNSRASKSPINFNKNGKSYKSSVNFILNIIKEAAPELLL